LGDRQIKWLNRIAPGSGSQSFPAELDLKTSCYSPRVNRILFHRIVFMSPHARHASKSTVGAPIGLTILFCLSRIGESSAVLPSISSDNRLLGKAGCESNRLLGEAG
jgi:hypothetical protein